VNGDVDLARLGAILADRTRASILTELLGGAPLPSGELARRASASPSAASNHLRRLLDEGLVEVVVDGRRRLYRLAGGEVAAALEALARIAPAKRVTSLRTGRRYEAIRDARTCYDHLAGRLGVGLADRLVATGVLRRTDSAFEVTRRGAAWLEELGVDVEQTRRARRLFSPFCLDLTERRPHLAGALGAAVASAVAERGFVTRVAGSRALRLTDDGRRFFTRLGVV
jgi:DNA-binding transcriptional ArsR family regulator